MTEASAPTAAVNELPLLLVVIDDSDESSVALAYACARPAPPMAVWRCCA